ncbi:MAG: DEAD/DEAH box helicase [Saprospiraceae bacterium]|jgi:ATP-dependent RNA helicase RhlE|nr:DEAD/DEAH box helicase [Saprospiraceae bacterium]MDP4699016.1 DEAD/DEAH box helicase [Saprospiraceae bacterium]MDP4810440.1 DEAD/DEAH box helicase [Saprospiraceae bacterium]MDP4814815.1 DEAD/DEAH box helicase [Saprospiraceae bacterium]MDP4913005.1 DEAD/DEAH box helicase [Saprospiraceae bacterium]
MVFEDLGIMPAILEALKGEGYINPTPIQEKAIPILIKGKDLQGCAQTGTGKTAAFAIPILQRLSQNPLQKNGPKPIRTLILTPTRELAIQIGESFASYGKNVNINHTVIFGGVSQGAQVDAIRRGVDIVIATPGRLIDLNNQGLVSLNKIEIFVLDEADRMLDMGFVNDVKKIIKLIPKHRQSIFFSATMPDSITQLASSILTQPQYVEVTPVSSTAETIAQELYFVDMVNKRDLLLHILKDKELKSILVFTRTKHGADKVVKLLERESIKAAAIHGNKSQNARQKALNDFKDKKLRVLVATDIAARGIDIDELELVINYEIPNIPETYVHRIGRTGRAGQIGKAISFCDSDERIYMRDILKLTKINIPVANEHPFLPADGNTDLSTAVKPKAKAPLPRENRPRNHAYGSTSKGGNGQRKRENSF